MRRSGKTTAATHRLACATLVVTLLTPFPAQALAPAAELANRKAVIIESMHRKARKALVNAAQDPAYAALALAGHDHAHSGAHRQTRERVDRISLSVQNRFAVEEMCLIAPDGKELSRIVGREVADDLSEDETGAVFFAPSFAKRRRTVYTSPPYLSPDAHKWVIAYVTPVADGGRTVAILHYEHGLDAYQERFDRDVPEGAVVLAVTGDGWIFSDSRAPIDIDSRNGSQDPARYFARFELGGADIETVRKAIARGERLTVDGRHYDAAFRMVDDWTVLVLIRA